MEDANEFDRRKAIRHVMNEKNEKKKTLEENPKYKQGKVMSSGRKKGSIKSFSRILDNVISEMRKEVKNPPARSVWNHLYNHQDEYVTYSDKQLFTISKELLSATVDKKTALIYFLKKDQTAYKDKPMSYGTFKNRVSESKTRHGISSKK